MVDRDPADIAVELERVSTAIADAVERLRKVEIDTYGWNWSLGPIRVRYKASTATIAMWWIALYVLTFCGGVTGAAVSLGVALVVGSLFRGRVHVQHDVVVPVGP